MTKISTAVRYKRKAACWPFHSGDCYIWNHWPPISMKPKNQTKTPRPAAAARHDGQWGDTEDFQRDERGFEAWLPYQEGRRATAIPPLIR
jgi:hypothetical protein